jgi:hypothetical protein
LRLAAAAVAAAALTAGVLVSAYSDDRRVASDYRETLAQANGKYFEAARLRDVGGRPVGQVFAYEGSPSWVTIVLSPGATRGTYQAELVRKDGGRTHLRRIRFGGETTGSAQIVVQSLRAVAKLRLIGTRPGEVLEAELGRR